MRIVIVIVIVIVVIVIVIVVSGQQHSKLLSYLSMWLSKRASRGLLKVISKHPRGRLLIYLAIRLYKEVF